MTRISQTAVTSALLFSTFCGLCISAAAQAPESQKAKPQATAPQATAPQATARQVAGTGQAASAPLVEVCFVLDTTGSMKSLIQGAKDKIWSIANELVAAKPTPVIKFGLVAYRDRNDDYVTKVYDLTDDIDAIYQPLMAFQANGGGDTPESVNQALHDAVAKMSWSKGRRVLKLVFLVGDAPPHMDYADDMKYPKVCQMAMKKSLIINTIQCGNMTETTKIWNDIARKSEGQFTAILQSGGTVAIKTPFDKEIADVNRQLNMTIVGYGDAAVQSAVRTKVAANAASKSEAVADRADFYRALRSGGGGSGGKVLGGADDLVEQLIQKKIKLKDIDASKLPADLKKLTREQQVAVIKTRIEKRQELQEKIDTLLKQRGKFVVKEKARQAKEGKVESFDLKVKEIIKSQGARIGIDFDTSGK